ncbi:MAG: ankyrin repeat domain-containing protein [Rhizobiaceae bacterium]
MLALARLLIFCLLVPFTANATNAQIAPSNGEKARYEGLFEAANAGDVEEIRRLVGAGANIEARDSNGRTALHIAAHASHDDALRALSELGADLNALEGQAYDVVTIAAVANDPDLMSLAINLGNSPRLTTSPYDGTALIAAAHLGHVEVVRRLITAGSPLDHVNNLGWTALIEAVILGDGGANHQTIVRLLLAAGADRKIADREGITPLQHAEARGYSEIASILRPKQ